MQSIGAKMLRYDSAVKSVNEYLLSRESGRAQASNPSPCIWHQSWSPGGEAMLQQMTFGFGTKYIFKYYHLQIALKNVFHMF